MRSFALFAFVITLFACTGALVATPAQAQLSRGNLRLSIDGDILSVSGVKIGNGKEKVIGFGPNQTGPSRVYGGPTPLGLGVGYVLQPKLILGVRVGLGYDVEAPEGRANNTRYLGLSIMPELRFVPMGERAKLFIAFAPIFQVGRAKQEGANTGRTLLGGFSLGAGAFIFVTNALSADLGFHFEGRFGGTKNDDDRESTNVQDLRAVVRVGVSLWT